MSIELRGIKPLPSDHSVVTSQTQDGYRNDGFLSDKQDVSGVDDNRNFTCTDSQSDQLHESGHEKTDDADADLTKDDNGCPSYVVAVDDDWENYEPEDLPPVDPAKLNLFLKLVARIQGELSALWHRYHSRLWTALAWLMVAGYLAYFGYAMYYEQLEHEQSIRLCWVTCVVIFFIVLHYTWNWWGSSIKQKVKPCWLRISTHGSKISWFVVVCVLVCVVVFTTVDVFVISHRPYNMVSAAGLLAFIVLAFLFSNNPTQIQWKPVVWGLGLEFVFALVTLRWDAGYQAFAWVGDRVAEFTAYAMAGAEFVFGEDYEDHFFAFAVTATICYICTVMTVLYYLGVVQALIRTLSAFMQSVMGTTAGETLSAAANIFFAMTDCMLMIKPLLNVMTRSEIHAVMTAGLATISADVMGAYIWMGVPANHIIAASVMSAPAALMVSKLLYPESQVSCNQAKHVNNISQRTSHSLLEAVSQGAASSISVISHCMVNLIAFISLYQFVNTTLTWFGHRVGIELLTLPFVFSYLMYPFALLMGINLEDCRKVGMLVGIKVFLNEFIAYEELGNLIKNRQALESHVALNGTWEWRGDDVALIGLPGGAFNETLLTNGFISGRSETISTYALCSFANLGSMGIILGFLSVILPRKVSTVSGLLVRSMVAANVADFITACIAGLYYQE